MNGSKQEVEVQCWNRAHLKSLKLAALIAVGINPHQPLVTAEVAQWAIDFVVRDVELVVERFREGDVGQGDSKQFNDAKKAIEAWYSQDPKKVHADRPMWKDGIFPYSWMPPNRQRRQLPSRPDGGYYGTETHSPRPDRLRYDNRDTKTGPNEEIQIQRSGLRCKF